MLAEIATVVSLVKGLNDAIGTLKEAGGHATDISSVMGRYATANEAVQDVETKHVGKLSVKDSMQLQLAKRQLAHFNQTLKDQMLMAGLGADYKEIMNRVEESRLEHEKQIRIALIRRRKNIAFAKQLGVAVTAAFIGFGVMITAILLIFKKWLVMEFMDAIGVVWPIAVAFVTLVVVLAKMHADIEQIKEKIKVLFELWNKKD